MTDLPYSAIAILGTGDLTTYASHDGWRLTSTWQVQAGRPEPTSVEIDSVSGRRVTAQAIRALPIGEMLAASRTALAQSADLAEELVTLLRGQDPSTQTVPELLAEPFVNTLRALSERGPQRGRALRPDELAAVAAEYRRAFTSGEPVTAAVMAAFCLSKSGAAKRIMRARAAGLLEGVGQP